MRKLIEKLLVLAVVALIASTLQAQGRRGELGKQATHHGWMSNYREAKTLARDKDKPLMVVFRCVP